MLLDTLNLCLLDVDVVMLIGNCHLKEACNAVCRNVSISRTRCSFGFPSFLHRGYCSEAPQTALSPSSLPGAVQDVSSGF